MAVARDSRLPTWLPSLTHALLRIVAALMFMQHGAQKLFGVLMAPGMPAMPRAALFSQFWFAGVLELFGGFLMLIGLFSRPVAFLLSGEMAVAYFQVHAPRGLFPIVNRGEVVVLFCFIWLFMFANGGGPFSVDAAMRERRRHL